MIPGAGGSPGGGAGPSGTHGAGGSTEAGATGGAGAAAAITGRDLRRRLGPWNAAALFIGNVVGSGIFVAPAAVAAVASGLGGAAALWLLGGLLAACGAVCYAECGSRLPRSGGFYVYYREAFGERLAFAGGWAAFIVTYPASIGAIALVCARYLNEAFPGLGGGEIGPAVAAIALSGAINILGVRLAAGLQSVLTASKVAALAALCLAALAVAGGGVAPEPGAGAGGAPEPRAESRGDGEGGRGDAPPALTTEGAPVPTAPAGPVAGWMAFLTAMVVVLWTYDGWSDVSLVAGEIRDPSRDLGRAVLGGIAGLVALYLIVQAAVSALLPPARAAASTGVVAEAVREAFGAGSGRVVALLVVLCTFGSVHGVIFTSSRLGFAMARDGAFFRWFGAVHPRFETPARAVAVVTAGSILAVLIAEFRHLLAFFSFGIWLFYALTAGALLLMRRRGTGEANAWRAPGGSAAPLIVLATCASMVAGLFIESPLRSLVGLALLLAAFPAHAIWRRVVVRAPG